MDKTMISKWLAGPGECERQLKMLTQEMIKDSVEKLQPQTVSALGTIRELEFRKNDHDGDSLLLMSYAREDGSIQDNEVAFMYPNRVQLMPINQYKLSNVHVE